METETKPMSAEQSLNLISNIIQQAQGNVRGNSFFFLLWGWVIALANFGMYYLMEFTTYPYPYIVWLAPIPAGFITMWYANKLEKQSRTKTHIDNIYNWVWVSYAMAIFPLWIFGYKINYQINPLILVFTAMPTFLSGIIIRFTPLMIGGVSFFGFGIICFLVEAPYQYLIGGIAIICGYLVPGYLLKYLKES